MYFRIDRTGSRRGSFDQLLTPNSGAFDLINVKSPICPGLGWGGGGFALTIDRCITISTYFMASN